MSSELKRKISSELHKSFDNCLDSCLDAPAIDTYLKDYVKSFQLDIENSIGNIIDQYAEDIAKNAPATSLATNKTRKATAAPVQPPAVRSAANTKRARNNNSPELPDTIEKLDQLIQKKYRDILQESAQVKRLDSLADYLELTEEEKEVDRKIVDELKTITRIRSSGNENDCLIHSFLTAVSRNFRRIPDAQKQEFASHFRRKIYAEFPRTKEKRGVEIERIKGKSFLEDADLQNLCAIYKVSFAVFSTRYSDTTAGLGRQTMPPFLSIIDGVDTPKNYYIICNRASIHFDALKTSANYYQISTKECNTYNNYFQSLLDLQFSKMSSRGGGRSRRRGQTRRRLARGSLKNTVSG